ncbi:unnamed protein product, partial [Prorocentrum cordatum]
MTDDSFDWEACYSTLYEADEQAAQELGGFDFWGADRQGQEGQGRAAEVPPAGGGRWPSRSGDASGRQGGLTNHSWGEPPWEDECEPAERRLWQHRLPQMPSQGGQAARSPAPGWMAACEAAEAAGAPGGAALARARAGALLASGAGAALGCGVDGRLQIPAGLQGVFGLQGYGPMMSDWVDQARTPDWQPHVSAPGHGLQDAPGGGLSGDADSQTLPGLMGVFGHQGYGPRMSDLVGQEGSPDWQPRVSASGHGPGGEAEGFSPSTSQPLPHKDSEFVAQQSIGDQVFGEFGSPACQEACSLRDPASGGDAACTARPARSSSPPLAPPPQPREGAALPRVPGATASACAAHLERLLAGKPKPMAKAGCCLATVNASSWGPLGEYLLRADGNPTLAIAVQEHHRLAKDLATQQRASKDAGWHGAWSAANPSSTSTSGSVGGVAVLAPTVVSVTAPLGRDPPVLVPGRPVAGHVRAGPAGGVVVLSIYLRDGEGLSGSNLDIIWQLVQYLGRLGAEGHHWAVMGDWNMEADVLDFGWIGKLRAQVRQASGQSCRQGGGSNIDYFVVSKSLIPFTGEAPILDVGAHTWPHWPVRSTLGQVHAQAVQQVIDEPKPLPREAAKPGCARPPWRWGAFARCVNAVTDQQGLRIIWDMLLEGIETEILNRRDLVGDARRTFADRGAKGGWASELLKKQAYLAKMFGALKDHPVEEATKPAAARTKCMGAIAKALVHLRHFLESLHGQGRVLQAAEQRQRKQAKEDEARWKEWVDGAFLGGAGAAHAASKAPVLQGVLPAHPSEEAQALVAREVHAVRDVVRSFSWRTGVGQSGMPPRALEDLSDDALLAMIAVFHKCEGLLAWPSSRLINTMVRPPKPDGGCRLIGLMPTLVRVWSRARRLVTKARELDNPSELVWGTGPGRASSDSAYELNLAEEQAKLGGWDSAQAALGLWKAYEVVAPEAQLAEARALGFPMRLIWMLLSTYRQPRVLAAFGTTSDPFVARQGNIAGCGHANSLLMVLTLRALRKAHALAPSVTPRGLVDDATLDWSGSKEADDDSLVTAPSSFSADMVELKLVMQPQKSGSLASSRRRAKLLAPHMLRRGLTEKFWVRNLGHELHGRKVIRTQEKRRLQALAERRGRMAMLRRAAGRRAAALVATGLSPSAGHGAGVSGLADKPLAQLRTLAAATAGAKAGCGTAAVTVLQRRVDFDPICAATAPLVRRLASRIWEGRCSLAGLEATWQVLAAEVRAGSLSWASVQGPLGATWLSLARIGWDMAAVWALQTDQGEDALVEGIQRWQRRRLVAHLPGSGGEVLWLRAARAIARRPLHHGLALCPRLRYAHGFATTELCQACGQDKDTLMHGWCACPEVMQPRDEELELEEPFRKPIVTMHEQMAEVAWPAAVYTDGSGRASQVPEARRCGWAAVALRPDGMPLKAPYGPLPGPRQTVGRAERQACLAPLSQAGEVQLIVSDLQSLVTEGNLWSPTAQAASARHASMWRQLHAAAEARGSPPPRFRRAPAHRTLEQALEEGIRPMDWLGNCWADFFANLGAAETRLPNNAVEALKAELQRALDTATHLGWAAARVCQLDPWRSLGDDGKLQRRAELKCPAPPKLSLTRHEYQAISARGVQCLHCGREARTEKARSLLDCRPCQPSALGRPRAARSREVGGAQLLASSAMVDAGPQVGQAFGPTEGGATGSEFERKVQHLLAAAKGDSAGGGGGSCGARSARAVAEATCQPFGPAPAAGNDLLAIDAWERAGPLEAALRTLASSWITDLLDQSLAYASRMEECVDYVYRLLGEDAFRGFFAHTTTPESRNAERLRKATEFCERGWRDGSPYREARIYEALQLEGGLRDARVQPPRGYHCAARAYLSDRGNARHAGGRQGHLHCHWWPPEALPGPNSLPSAGGGDHGFAGCWVFDLRDPDGAGAAWLAWAAQYALEWLARPGDAAEREEAIQRAGSIGLRALAHVLVRQAWTMEAAVRRAAVGHLMDLSTLEEWMHVAALQWATVGEIMCTIRDIVGEAAANLPAPPGFAGPIPGLCPAGVRGPSRSAGLPRPEGLSVLGGYLAVRQPWRNPQYPSLQQRGLDASDDDDVVPHPNAASSGLPPPPLAAAAGSGGQPPGLGVGNRRRWQVEAAAQGSDSSEGPSLGGDPAAQAAIHGMLPRRLMDAGDAGGDGAAAGPALWKLDGAAGDADGNAAERSRSPQRGAPGRQPRGEEAKPEAQLGHALRTVGGYDFCRKCGAFARIEGADRAKGLKAGCTGRLPPGPQATAGQKKKRQYLTRLLGAKDPIHGQAASARVLRLVRCRPLAALLAGGRAAARPLGAGAAARAAGGPRLLAAR